MFSSNSLKIFLLCAALFCQACGYCRSRPEANALPAPFVAEELKSDIPFSTKEPDIYQAEIVVTTNSGAEEKFFAAKNGANRLTVFDYQTKRETALLQIAANQSFIIAPNQKIYAENQTEIDNAKSSALNDFLTADLMNRKTDAKYETLGAENNLVRFRVRLDETQNSEIIIYVDEKIGLPVKQEFYSISGEEKKIIVMTELKNFNLQTEAKFFEVPKDFRKVTLKEFYEITRREKAK